MPSGRYARRREPCSWAAAAAALAVLIVAAGPLAENQAEARITGSQRIINYGWFPDESALFLPLYATSVPGTDLLAIAGKNGVVDFLDLTQPITGNNQANATRILELPIDRNVLFDDSPGLYTRNDSGLHGLAFHPQFATNGKFYVNATFDNSIIAESPFLDLMGQPTAEGAFDPLDGYTQAEIDLINATITNDWNANSGALVNQLFWTQPNYQSPPQARLNNFGQLQFVSPHPNPVSPPAPASWLNPGYVEVREYTYDDAAVDPDDYRLVLRYPMNFEFHNGGWIDFGPDGNLYITTGDSTGNPINHLTSPDDPAADWYGKVLRIDVDGPDAYPGDEGDSLQRNYAVPADNPFATHESPFAQAVWAYGLRHPWRASFDAETGDLWISDVGFGDPLGSTQSVGVEEVNFMPAGTGGANFGWPYFEGDLEFTALGPIPPGVDFTGPVHSYAHIPPVPGPADRGAITGGFVYRGSDPTLNGKYLFADSNRREIWMFDPSDGTAEDISDWLFTEDKRWRSTNAPVELLGSFGQDRHGNLYLTETSSNTVYRLFTSGDFNQDGLVDAADIDLLAAAERAGSDDPLYDLDGDGSVVYHVSPSGVSSDSDYLIRTILGTEYGDLNLNGVVDIIDFDIFGQGYREKSGWFFGDLNGSGGLVDILDFDIFGQFYGSSPEPPAQVVPEMTAAGLMAIACVALRVALGRKETRR